MSDYSRRPEDEKLCSCHTPNMGHVFGPDLVCERCYVTHAEHETHPAFCGNQIRREFIRISAQQYAELLAYRKREGRIRLGKRRIARLPQMAKRPIEVLKGDVRFRPADSIRKQAWLAVVEYRWKESGV